MDEKTVWQTCQPCNFLHESIIIPCRNRNIFEYGVHDKKSNHQRGWGNENMRLELTNVKTYEEFEVFASVSPLC